MAREKGSKGKVKKILIRVTKDEKVLAEKLSKSEGMNTSEFFRTLLKEKETGKSLLSITSKLEYTAGVIDNLVADMRKAKA